MLASCIDGDTHEAAAKASAVAAALGHLPLYLLLPLLYLHRHGAGAVRLAAEGNTHIASISADHMVARSDISYAICPSDLSVRLMSSLLPCSSSIPHLPSSSSPSTTFPPRCSPSPAPCRRLRHDPLPVTSPSPRSNAWLSFS